MANYVANAKRKKAAKKDHARGGHSDRQTDTRLDDLEKLATIGLYDVGRLNLVRHRRNGKCFALKVMKKADVIALRQIEHANNERQILSAVSMPFVVRMHKSFQDEKNLYLLEEFMIGGSLMTHLMASSVEGNGGFSTDVARFYACEVLVALEHLHELNIIYRNLCPESIMLDRYGHLKLVDFGVAKLLKDERTYTLCGRQEYLAPEIIRSAGYSFVSDFWSFGVFLYEMLVGRPPFVDDCPHGIYEKILEGRLRFPGSIDKGAKDLLKSLLVADASLRLGLGGAREIKDHLFFKGVKWTALLERRVSPPFVPTVGEGNADLSNFDVYPKEIEDMSGPEIDPFKEMFPDF